MAFEAFRKNGQPTFYDPNHTPWEGDVLTSGLIFAFIIIAFSFFIIIPGSYGWERLFSFIRITVSLFIGAVILVAQFSMTWECAETVTHTKYKAGTGEEVVVKIGAWIGFRGINVTMKGDDNQIQGETIDYNEYFSWEGQQGRLGFGPNAGRFNQEYRAAQFRGLPLPILYVAEYFTFDGEGIRWGRFYRQAGWYSHIMLWLAFPLWLLANILFCVLLRYGAYFLVMTGLSMLTCNIIWASLRNFVELMIPFSDTSLLEFSYGGSFWITLITGIACVILGVVIFLMDKMCPTIIATFFNVDVLQDSEKIFEEDEADASMDAVKKEPEPEAGPSIETRLSNEEEEEVPDEDEDDLYDISPPMDMAPAPPEDRAAPVTVRSGKFNKHHQSQYRSGESRVTKKFQKPRRRQPPPPPPEEEFDNVMGDVRMSTLANDDDDDDDDDENIYQNPKAPPLRKKHARF